jgi:hypothetical protein
MRLQLTGNGSEWVITLASATGSIMTDANAAWTGDTLTVNSAAEPVIIDLWTINGGTTVFANYVGVFA